MPRGDDEVSVINEDDVQDAAPPAANLDGEAAATTTHTLVMVLVLVSFDFFAISNMGVLARCTVPTTSKLRVIFVDDWGGSLVSQSERQNKTHMKGAGAKTASGK